ncbi:penicillin acylase family protein [Dermatobacter hominis]|uniref:penicillin acylase family protein n=1 Tax=Dermatobacter hominis TaxID=2884263 RepID=UPI001D12B006|nr:penicillin acylase family protein [Dermatobacter hominis]UDY36724.1 penicillin acylase family protein [Dermatobacter hominis]
MRRRSGRGRAALGAVAVVLVAGLVAACTVGPPAPTRGPEGGTPVAPPPTGDPALISLSVMPPGNGGIGGPTAAHLDDQRERYDRIDDAVADGTLDDATLAPYFKDAGLGTSTPVRTETPAAGVTIAWDRWGVPRVEGDTAEEVAWGAGWAVADARLLVAEAGRLLGRAGTIEMGGSDDIVKGIQQVGTLPQLAYTDEELLDGLDRAVAAAGPEGPKILSSIDAFVDGINAWLDRHTFPPELLELGLQWRHWTRADVIAVGAAVDDIFGSGGGDEVGNARALAALRAQLGDERGRSAFERLRHADDPAATAHVGATFPYPVFATADGGPTTDTAAIDPAAVALPDQPVAVAEPAATPSMSNYMALTGARTASGHPILVGGPQSSYFAPQLLFEMELRGGGYDARGITFPGLGPWVVIGRNRDAAWTATAGGSDMSDQRMELLCEPDGSAPRPDSLHYVFQGECRSMTRPDAGEMTAWRTVHGPVVGRTTVDGRPVAIARERLSRFQTGHAAPAFWALNQGLVDSADDFARAMSDVPMSFNWVYVDAHDVATFHSGWYPIRASGVDPDLPSWGTGEWEWKGRLDWRRQPQVVDPSSGFAVSWNNHVAPGWREPDSDWSSGAVQRVDLLDRRAAALHDATPADVVRAVQDAATVDVRGARVLPAVLDLLDAEPAPSDRLDQVRDELATWVAAGAHRRDRDDDGWYDDHAVAVLDVAWEALVGVAVGPDLRSFTTSPDRRPKVLDNPPSQTGGAYGYGWYSAALDGITATTTGQGDADGPRCGGGDVDRCRTELWAVLGAAADSAGPWPRLAVGERIRFIPYVFNLQSMRWQNRPTFQQVVSFGG